MMYYKQFNNNNNTQPPLIVGITGASGSIYALKLLETLYKYQISVFLIVTKAAKITIKHELGISLSILTNYAAKTLNVKNIAAEIASGSFVTKGMIIAPCTMHTLACIAHGIHHDLLTRAADVTLKEKRTLLLMIRETPLSLIHLKNMQIACQAGAIIFPPVPAFYHQPQSIDDLVMSTVYRIMDFLGIKNTGKKWGGLEET